jgi:hypothetical protein
MAAANSRTIFALASISSLNAQSKLPIKKVGKGYYNGPLKQSVQKMVGVRDGMRIINAKISRGVSWGRFTV